MAGITRQTVIDIVARLAEEGGWEWLIAGPVVERRLSLAEFHAADEVFTTGTMGELTPVVQIDGRRIGHAAAAAAAAAPSAVGGAGAAGPVTQQIQRAYRQLTETGGVPIP